MIMIVADKDDDDEDDFDVEDDGISLDILIKNLQQILTYLGRNNLKHACTHILANAIQTKTRILMNIQYLHYFRSHLFIHT